MDREEVTNALKDVIYEANERHKRLILDQLASGGFCNHTIEMCTLTGKIQGCKELANKLGIDLESFLLSQQIPPQI